MARLLRDGVEPAAGDTDSLVLSCPRGAEPTLERAREVLAVVFIQSQASPRPSLEEWVGLLPTWFVAACTDDVAGQSCVLDRWSLRAWIYWFEPERRGWRWWGVEVADRERLRVVLLVEARPYLRGALEWLFRVAGASAAEA